MEVLYIRATRRQVKAALRQLPAIAAGRAPDPTGLVKTLNVQLGLVALTQIKLDFEIKGRGGVGSDGIQWAPLKPSTIARRRNKDKASIQILRDTDVLFSSLSPGIPRAGGNGATQIFDTSRAGEVIVGARGIKTIHHRGYTMKNGTKVSARSFWPRDGRFPGTWWKPIIGIALRVVKDIALRLGGEAAGPRSRSQL